MENVTLNVKDLYYVRKAGEGTYKEGTKNAGKPYVVLSYDGRGFTVPKEVHDLMQSGTIVEMRLGDNEYEREDPLNPGVMVKIKSWNYLGSITKEQKKSINEVEFDEAEHTAKIGLITKRMAAEYKLNTSTLEAAL